MFHVSPNGPCYSQCFKLLTMLQVTHHTSCYSQYSKLLQYIPSYSQCPSCPQCRSYSPVLTEPSPNSHCFHSDLHYLVTTQSHPGIPLQSVLISPNSTSHGSTHSVSAAPPVTVGLPASSTVCLPHLIS